MYVGISHHRVCQRLRVCRLVCKNDERIYPYQATDGVSNNYTKDYPDKLVINI